MPRRLSACLGIAAFLTVLAPAVAPAQPGEQRTALVIGNGAYADAPLANPVNDAQDVARALTEIGFKVTLRTNANQRAMKQAVREFGAQLKQGGVGLFYFAGHGVQSKGRNYLMPVGATIENEADLEDESVDANLVLGHMDEAQNRVNIVILDACRNNPFARSFRSASRGLAQMEAARGSFVAFATAPGQVASDGSGRNGTYTKHFLQSLRQPASDLERVFKRVTAGVSQETGGRQVPWVSSSLTGDFYFRPGDAAAPAAPAPAVGAVDPLAVELAFWDSIKSSTNPGDFKAYLDQFPDGRFAALARSRAVVPAPAPPPVSVAIATPPPSAPPAAGAGGLRSPSALTGLSLGPVSPSFPAKPIRLVVPFAAGGVTDTAARIVAQKLSELSGQPVIVDNRPGAGGAVGGEVVAKAVPDGYTLLLGSTASQSINPSLSRLPYDATRDFTPVTLIGSTPLVLVVHPSVPASSIRDLVALAKSRPGGLNVASSGPGSLNHVVAEMFQSAAGVRLTHVPYRGSAPALNDLLGGQVQLLFGDLIAVVPHVRAGKLRALAVTSTQRSPLLPDVPTLGHSGLADFEAMSWLAVFAPAGTPRDVLNKLHQLIVRALNASDVAERFTALGLEPLAASPDDTATYVRAQLEKYRRVVGAAGIRTD